MKAALWTEAGRDLELVDLAVAGTKPDEVRVRVIAAGVCHTDLSIRDGHLPLPPPVVLGHEPAGIVLDVGRDVEHVAVGDHVVGFTNPFCGRCAECARGETYLCRSPATMRSAGEPPRLSRDGAPVLANGGLGAFAEEMLCHGSSIVPIPKDLPLAEAALLGCGISTGLGAVLRTAAVRKGETVAILGCGGVGLAAVQGARIAGASRIFAVDTRPTKLEMARKLGATDLVSASADVVQVVTEATSGGVDHAFECIGAAETTAQALAMTRMGGASVLIGVMPFGQSFSVPAVPFVTGGKRLLGCVLGSTRSRVDLPAWVDLWREGRLDVSGLVSRHFELSGVNEAMAFTATAEGARSLVHVGSL